MTASGDLRRVRLEGEGSFLVGADLDAGAVRGFLDRHAANVARGDVLKRDGRSEVSRVELDSSAGRAVVVKRSLIPARWRLGVRFGLVTPYARDFRVYSRLSALGVASPRVLVASLRPTSAWGTLVTESLEGGRTLREWTWLGDAAIDDEPARGELFSAVGSWLRGLHDAGVWHRDLKPNNIYVRREPALEFLLLDTTGLRVFARALDDGRRARNLAQIVDLPRGLDAEASTRVLEGYCRDAAGGLGALRRRVESAVEVRRENRRRANGVTYVDEEGAR